MMGANFNKGARMTRSRRLTSVFCSGLLAMSLAACQRNPEGSTLDKELPKELLDVLPIGEKRPVEVVLASPKGEMAELDQGQAIVISFNQPIVPLRPVSTDANVDFVEITPKVEGRFRWKGTATLTFEPKTPLPMASRFEVKVKKGLKSWSGQELGQDYKFEFTTPTVRLAHSLPLQDAELQGTLEPIYLHFNQPVKAEDLKASLELRQGNSTVACTVRAYNEEDRKVESRSVDLQEAWSVPREKGLVSGAAENALVVVPDQPLAAGTSTTVLLKAGLKSALGPVATTQESSLSFTTRREFALSDSTPSQGVDPENGLYLSFTTPVNPAVLRKSLTVEPPIALPDFDEDADYGSYDVYLGGDLKPNTAYHVKVADDLVDRYGAKLIGKHEITIQTGDYRPLLMGAEGSGLLELGGNQKIPYGIRNLSELTASYKGLSPAEVIAVSRSDKALYSTESYSPPGGFSKTLDLGGCKTHNQVEQRDLALPGGGFYYVQVNGGDFSQRSLVAVTDVGVTAKYSAENLMIYTTSLKDARAIGQAQVELYDADGNKLWSGSTDAEGFCQAPGWAKLGLKKAEEWSPPDLWVFVKSGSSQTFVHSQGYNSISPWAFDINYDSDQQARRFQAFAFSERGVYRPGETVQLKGSVRELSEGSWKLPELDKVYYKVVDSRDKEVSKGELKLNRFGGFDTGIAIKPGAPTGLYRVDFTLPEALSKSLKQSADLSTVTFQVEAFHPAQFEVTVTGDKPYYVMGDKAKMELKGWYLFGAPMNDRPMAWTARLEPAVLRPDGFDGYDFGIYSDDEHEDQSKELSSGNLTLDAKGLANPELNLDKIPFKGSAQLVVEGTATSPNRQQLAGRKVFPLHRGEVQLGVRQGSFFAETGKPQKVEVVAVRPDGQTQQGMNVKLELVRREWNSVRKAEPSGGYRWVSEFKDETVDTQQVRTGVKAVEATLTPAKAGYYVVRASLTDGRGNLVASESSFYASGSDYVAWERVEGDNLELVADRKKYKPGDTATILVKSPYEKTRALVTLERDHIMDRFVVDLEGTAPTIKIPLTSRHLPNVYASVILLQGRNPKQEFGPDGQDLSKPGFKIGYVNLPVEPEEKKLQVTVKTDKEKYAPGDEVVASFEVHDAAGKPAEAELCVAVPDQGVLALTGYELPDWFSAFYGPRALAVTTCETRMDVIGQRAYGTKGANPGGGGGFEASEGRDDFRYTAYWNASLTTDSSGKAEARFKLPDNLSTFRVMAMAQSERSQFGSAESKFEVAKPLQLQPSTPDFARVGDQFKAGVVVRNNSKDRLSVQVNVTAENLKATGEPQQTVELEAGKEKEVLFAFEAGEPKAAKLTFQCQGGSYSDKLVLPVDVQQPVVLENVSTSGSTTESAAVEMVVPSPMASGSGILRLFLSSSALVGLQGPLQELELNRWYGLEPLLSRIRGGLAGQQLTEMLQLQQGDHSLEGDLEALRPFAVDEKGFASYPGLKADPYLTAYTLETLERAKAARLVPDSKYFDWSRAFLKEYLNNPDTYSVWLTPSEKRINRCYALYALSLGQFDGLSYFNNLMRNRMDLPVEARAYLLLAGRRMGAGQSDLDTLRQDLLNSAKVEAATIYFKERGTPEWWSFSSDNKLTALVLKALLESPQGYPDAAKVVAWLMEARTPKGDWGSTHDNARVMETLYGYLQEREKESPNFTAKAFLGKEQIQEVAFHGRKLVTERSSTPVASSPQRLAVGIKKDGPGRLYYEIRLSYAAAKEPPARDEGLAVLKKISNTAGDRFPAELKAGETYLVTLTVVSPKDRRFVVVTDPIPAGCEVVQTQFETESAQMSRILAAAQSKQENATFLHFEKYADRVALFADGLQAGEHTFQYLIRANQPGSFRMPATKAEEMYHPEIFGTTLSRVVEIR